MKCALLWFALLSLACAPGAWGSILLYDNTTTDTGDTQLYSVGSYIALGDEIQLISAGTANQAEVELFNNGGAGTFDAELDLFDIGAPVGAQIGSSDLTDITSVGGDVLNLTFNLGALTVPQNLIFTVSVRNQLPDDVNAPLDLGVDMFEPPTVGTSNPSFMIAETSGPSFFQLTTTDEDVYFQLSGIPVVMVAPEASSLILLATGLLFVGASRRMSRRYIPGAQRLRPQRSKSVGDWTKASYPSR